MESIVRVPQLSHRRQLWKLCPQFTPASWFKRLPQRISDRKRIPESRSVICFPHFSFIQRGRSHRCLRCARLASLRSYLVPTSRNRGYRSALLYQPWSTPCYCLNYPRYEFVPPIQRIRGNLPKHPNQLSLLCWHASSIISSCMLVVPQTQFEYFQNVRPRFSGIHGLTWKKKIEKI